MKQCIATAVLWTMFTAKLCAQGSAFTYQGRLADNGVPYNGTIELEATLWDAATNGAQILRPRPEIYSVEVTNGLFTITLDFGKAAFTGAQRWLQIHLRTSPDPTPFTTLWPRQKITATPHAMVAERLTGFVPVDGLAGFYTNQVLFDNPQNLFVGEGSDLLNLNASQLTSGTVPSAALSNAWRIGGNAGTTPGTHFLGTTDNQPLELKVNGFRGLRLEPHSSGLPNLIGGANNQIAGVAAAVIAGGYDNRIESGADVSAILGGYFNTIQNNGAYGVVLGGRLNSAGRFALAAGHQANANHEGSFVWADSLGGIFASGATNEFAVRASGGARFVTGGAGMTLDGQPVLSGLVGAAQLAPGALSYLGTPDGSQTGAVQVINGGLVGIGTNAPGAGLHINAGASFLTPKVLFEVADGTGSYTNLSLPQQVAVSGNLLAVTAFFDNAVTLLDIANPAAPVVVTQLWDGNGVFTNLSGADGLAFSGSLLAVGSVWDDTVTLIDVSNPADPIKVAELRDGIAGFNALQSPTRLALTGNLLAIGSENALTLVDVSNPANPLLRTVLTFGTNGFSALPGPYSIAASGNLLALSSTNAVLLVDVSNPSNPILRSTITDQVNGFNDLTTPYGLAFSGNLLAVAAYLDNAVTLIDVANPANPQLRTVLKDGVAGYTGLNYAYGLAFSGDLLGITALADNALTLVDVSDPSAPLLRGIFRHGQGGIDFMLTPRGIAVAGGIWAVAASSSHGLTLIEPVAAQVSLTTAERVGIGTTLPAAPLHVVGNVVVEGAEAVEIRSDRVGLGQRAIATGLFATAIGLDTEASGYYSTAIGWGTTASGDGSTALGASTTASGFASFVVGNGSRASGENSFALGVGNLAEGEYSFAVGRSARSLHDGTFVWADNQFAGFASTSSNQFLIRARGGVGIGTTSPESLLDVEGLGTTNGGVLGFPEVVARVKRTGASHSALAVDATTGQDAVLYLAENGYARWAVRHDADQAHELDIRYSAPGMPVGLEALKLTTNGNLIVAGTISGTIASNTIATAQITDGSVAAIDINAGSFSTTFWKTDGNASTTPATHFLGTTDNQALEMRVNNSRIARFGTGENITLGSPENRILATVNNSTIAGGDLNTNNSSVSVIGGGAENTIESQAALSFIGGGWRNTVHATSDQSAIAGGNANKIQSGARESFIGGGFANSGAAVGSLIVGGFRNTNSGANSIIGGGGLNTIETGSADSSIGGGSRNLILANSPFATIPGGRDNAATNYAFAAGRRAKANHTGAFVWADSSNADFASTDDDQFLIRAAGGVGIGTPSPQTTLHVYATNNPTVVRIQSANGPGFGRLEFMSDPQGSINEWRPGYIQSTDNGNFTGGLAFFVNGSEHANRLNTIEAMRIVNGRVGIGTAAPANLLTVEGIGATNGGVLGFSEVVGRFRRTGASHTAVSIDAETGRDSVLYLAENGQPRWALRHDADQNHELDFRYSITPATSIEALRISTNGTVTTAGPVNPPSDRNVKSAFQPVNVRSILEKVAALPLTTWAYTNSPDIRHVGPVAQDFHAAFGVGTDDKHIATVDADGVALAAIQGLNEKLEEKDAEIQSLKERLANLERLLAK